MWWSVGITEILMRNPLVFSFFLQYTVLYSGQNSLKLHINLVYSDGIGTLKKKSLFYESFYSLTTHK